MKLKVYFEKSFFFFFLNGSRTESIFKYSESIIIDKSILISDHTRNMISVVLTRKCRTEELFSFFPIFAWYSRHGWSHLIFSLKINLQISFWIHHFVDKMSKKIHVSLLKCCFCPAASKPKTRHLLLEKKKLPPANVWPNLLIDYQNRRQLISYQLTNRYNGGSFFRYKSNCWKPDERHVCVLCRTFSSVKLWF